MERYKKHIAASGGGSLKGYFESITKCPHGKKDDEYCEVCDRVEGEDDDLIEK